MKKPVQVLLGLAGIVMIPLAFAGGLYIGGKKMEERAERVIQSEADALEYSSSIYNAQHYGELLLYARQGNTAALVHRLEYLADASLLTACAHKSNAMLRAMPKGPWSELLADRSTHPRGRTPQDEARISSLLGALVLEEPQQGGPANRSHPVQPGTNQTSAAAGSGR